MRKQDEGKAEKETTKKQPANRAILLNYCFYFPIKQILSQKDLIFVFEVKFNRLSKTIKQLFYEKR